MNTLESLGWTRRFESFLPELPTGRIGRVARIDRGRLVVLGTDGSSTLDSSTLADRATVGDWMIHDDQRPLAILPRSGLIARRRPGAAETAQAVAANVDLVLLVEALDRSVKPRRLERGCALAWEAGAQPLILLTKADLCDDLEAAKAAAESGAPWVDRIALSATTDQGFAELAERLGPGISAVLIGPSGAGKSTLTNQLLGEDRLATGAVRGGDAKGRHTTTWRELVPLPSGGVLIDTPGIRELGLWISAEAVDATFDDITALAPGCRFGDCAHDGEPGCAVHAAIESGALAADRLDSYHRLKREVEVSESRRSARARAEARARDKSFAKLVRAELRRKGSK